MQGKSSKALNPKPPFGSSDEDSSLVQLLQLLDVADESSPQQQPASEDKARRPSGLVTPKNWLPPLARPSLHTHHWRFNDFRIVVGSDLDVYSDESHQGGVSCRVHPSGEMWEPVTAVDAYLDQIMASIPELALMMESKGYIRGYKLLETRNIPKVDVSDSSQAESLKFLEKPLFDSCDLELNAANLLRFLKTNCTKNGATYLLQRESAPVDDGEEGGRDTTAATGDDAEEEPLDCVRLFDLSSMSCTPQRKWKWLLAMLSFRFANRTRLLMANAASRDFRATLQQRFRELLETCVALLQSLAEMGGHGHEMLQGNCHNLLAESFLVVLADTLPTEKNAPTNGNTAVAAQTAPDSSSTATKDLTFQAKLRPRSRPTTQHPLAVSAAPPPFAILGKSEPSSPQAEAPPEEAPKEGGGKGGGWPGRACEKSLAEVTVADLEKAQSHLLKGLTILEAIVKRGEDDGGSNTEEEEEEEEEEGEVGGSDSISASVEREAKRLRLRLVEVTLSLSSRQIATWRASSATSNLRSAAAHLRAFARSREEANHRKGRRKGLKSSGKACASSREVEAWLWELCSRLCRSVAGNRFEWVEKAGVHAQDLLAFCEDVAAILSPPPPQPAESRQEGEALDNAVSTTKHGALHPQHHLLHSLSFADPCAWQHHLDLQSLPLEAAAAPPFSTTAPTLERQGGFAGCTTPDSGSSPSKAGEKGQEAKAPGKTRSGRQRKRVQSGGDDGGDDAASKDRASSSPLQTAEPSVVAFPTPLLIASALCAAKALEALSPQPPGEASGGVELDSAHAKSQVLLQSRLGDACNEVGKALLRTVNQTPSSDAAEAAAEDQRLFGAMLWFQRGLVCFSADAVNSALLLCNLASAKKLLAGRVPRSGRHNVWRRHPDPNNELSGGSGPGPDHSATDKKLPVVQVVELLLSEAIADCYSAMERLGDRGRDPRTWDHISAELAMAYLTLGVRRRQALLTPQGQTSGHADAVTSAVTPGQAKRVAEPLEKAAAIYEGLGDQRQLAATRYQAGTLWSRLWVRSSDPRRGRERLGLALAHYEAAHAYYARGGQDSNSHEVMNTTLVMIDLDLCDLYSAVHAASQAGNAECLEKGLLCLLETHRAFAEPSPSLVLAQLVELVRLCAKIAERLPKLLLQLTKASAAVVATAASVLSSQLQSPPANAKSRANAEVAAECFKKLYRAALTFKWPVCSPALSSNSSSGVVETDLRQGLRRVASFLLHDLHSELVQLRKRKVPSDPRGAEAKPAIPFLPTPDAPTRPPGAAQLNPTQPTT